MDGTGKFQDIKLKANIFNWLLVISIPVVIGFYWPNHDVVFMKLLAMQTAIIIIFSIHFMFSSEIRVNDIFPGLMLVLFVINTLTHKLQDNTLSSLAMCLYVVLGMYCLMNSLSYEFVPIIQKTIVIFGIINVVSFFLEKHGMQAPFIDVGIYNSNRASGFMIYPAHFALLCSVACVFAWSWNKFLCIPLILGLFFVNELSVNIGMAICLIIQFRNSFNKWIWIIVGILALSVVVYFHGHLLNYLRGKCSVRFMYWKPMLEQCFTRIADGWGFGSYSNVVDKVLPNLPKNAWPQLHNELLQGFLEGGLLFISLLILWFMDLKRRVLNNDGMKYVFCFILFLCTSMGHSVFHFCDCLWLFIVIYGLFHVEYHEANLRWDLENGKTC